MRQVFTLVLMTILSSGAAAQTQTKVPREFQGEWNMKVADCGSALNDSVLKIRTGSLTYYESSGPVRAVIRRGRQLALLAELTGEGETSVHAARFSLSRNGQTLTDELSAPPLVRYRCPTRRR